LQKTWRTLMTSAIDFNKAGDLSSVLNKEAEE
jgi:hypothetical protein